MLGKPGNNYYFVKLLDYFGVYFFQRNIVCQYVEIRFLHQVRNFKLFKIFLENWRQECVTCLNFRPERVLLTKDLQGLRHFGYSSLHGGELAASLFHLEDTLLPFNLLRVVL